MSAYRTPDEDRAQTEHESRVQAVLDQATKDGTMLYAAMLLGEDQDVVEKWTDRLWDGLRDGLSDFHEPEIIDGSRHDQEDRLTAIVMLLTPRISVAANLVVDVEDGVE